jgi:hypothetical protein
LEQRYHIDKRRLLNRMLHGGGVVAGLEVAREDGTVTVAPGFAIDSCGREILVCEPQQLAIPTGEAVSICLLYAEVETDHGTIRETYELIASTAAVAESAVVLSVLDTGAA